MIMQIGGNLCHDTKIVAVPYDLPANRSDFSGIDFNRLRVLDAAFS